MLDLNLDSQARRDVVCLLKEHRQDDDAYGEKDTQDLVCLLSVMFPYWCDTCPTLTLTLCLLIHPNHFYTCQYPSTLICLAIHVAYEAYKHLVAASWMSAKYSADTLRSHIHAYLLRVELNQPNIHCFSAAGTICWLLHSL